MHGRSPARPRRRPRWPPATGRTRESSARQAPARPTAPAYRSGRHHRVDARCRRPGAAVRAGRRGRCPRRTAARPPGPSQPAPGATTSTGSASACSQFARQISGGGPDAPARSPTASGRARRLRGCAAGRRWTAAVCPPAVKRAISRFSVGVMPEIEQREPRLQQREHADQAERLRRPDSARTGAGTPGP